MHFFIYCSEADLPDSDQRCEVKYAFGNYTSTSWSFCHAQVRNTAINRKANIFSDYSGTFDNIF